MTTRGFCDVALESRYTSPSRSRTGNSWASGASARAGGWAVITSGGRRGDLVADPAVAALLELLDELGAALLDDAPVEHDRDPGRLHQVQDPLVVGDDQDAHLRRLADVVDGMGDDVQRV